MKRLFPRAVPETLIALLLFGGACAPSSNPKAGAPVLTTLTLIDPSGNKTDVTKDTPACAAGAAEGKDCDPGTAVCELDTVLCKCNAKDMCDPTIMADAAATGGTLNCTFPPTSKILATFDRLLDTTPFDAKTAVATLEATPATTATAATDYTSTGIPKGLLFTPGVFGVPAGPNITLTGSPALPTDSTVTFTLDKTTVLAKDKKTPFTGENLLADGKIGFKTSSFSADVSVPAPPPPMDMGGGGMKPMGCPGAGMPPADGGTTEGGAADGGTDTAVAEGGVDGGVHDAPADLPAAADAASEAAVATEAGTGSEGGSEGGTTPPPSTDVPAGMNMGAITITFTNPVGPEVLTHITMTEDGKPFTGFVTPDPTTFPMTAVKITPMTMWAAGKKYTITVDADAADVLGKKLGAPLSASFTMSAN